MIDAHHATLIAYVTEDGEIIHKECAPIRGTSEDWEVNDQIMEDHGFTGLIRYHIHEYESQNWSELEWADVDGIEDVPEEDYNYQDETVGSVDVSPYIGIFCATCSERIE